MDKTYHFKIIFIQLDRVQEISYETSSQKCEDERTGNAIP